MHKSRGPEIEQEAVLILLLNNLRQTEEAFILIHFMNDFIQIYTHNADYSSFIRTYTTNAD